MLSKFRIPLAAAALLLLFFSLPLWLPPFTAASLEGAEVENAEPDLSDAPTLYLTDAGWIGGSLMADQYHSAAILGWDPAGRELLWLVETGQINGGYVDEEQGRIYLVERRSPAEGAVSPVSGGPAYLTILDSATGDLLRRAPLDAPVLGDSAHQFFPLARVGRSLYLRNYARDGLRAYDLEAQAFADKSWALCERGYPGDSIYMPAEQAFLTFCMDLSSGMSSTLTKVFIENGASLSVELPRLGDEEYMFGNGFAMGPDGRAYVVDSDGGMLVEIDVAAMRVLRQADYRPTADNRGRGQALLDGLLRLAARPAQAKRWLSFPAVSPDGRYLVVDSGFGVGGGSVDEAWLIRLDDLEVAERIQLPATPRAFRFLDAARLLVLLENEEAGGGRLFIYDLELETAFNAEIPELRRPRVLLP